MIRLLERLERVARPGRPDHSPRHLGHRDPRPTSPGFLDCRGEWHAWEDRS